MKSPMRLLQKKKELITEAHSSWVLRTNLPSTHVSPAGRRQSPFHLVCLTPRSRRYRNITLSRGPRPIWAKLSHQPHLHCAHSAYSLASFAEAQPPGFLSQSSGVACTGESSLPAAHIRCQLRWDSIPVSAASRQAAGFGKLDPLVRYGEVLPCLRSAPLNSWGKVGS